MKERIINIIESAVKDYSEQTQNQQIAKPDIDTALFGTKAAIDSIGLVTIIVATEQKMEDEFGQSITLADERAMSQKNSPFLTIGSLADYIIKLLNGESDE